MSINLIIIARDPNAQTYIDTVKSYNITTEENTNVIYPTDTTYETSLVIPLLKGDMYNIIMYDWCFTLYSPEDISIFLDTVVQKSFDVVYLGKYLDTCNKYLVDSKVQSLDFVTGTSPLGMSAVLLSGAFATTLKNELMAHTYYSINYAINILSINSTVNSFAISPNLFVYNPLYNSIDVSKSYSVKTTECQALPSEMNPPSDNNFDIFWVFIIIIFSALIIWVLVTFTSLGKEPYASLRIQTPSSLSQ
jgi:hypothetical protein